VASWRGHGGVTDEQGGSGRTSIINDFSNEYIPEISAISPQFWDDRKLKIWD
jgi:hypothetical protein